MCSTLTECTGRFVDAPELCRMCETVPQMSLCRRGGGMTLVNLVGRVKEHAHFERRCQFEDNLLKRDTVEDFILRNAWKRHRVELLAL